MVVGGVCRVSAQLEEIRFSRRTAIPRSAGAMDGGAAASIRYQIFGLED